MKRISFSVITLVFMMLLNNYRVFGQPVATGPADNKEFHDRQSLHAREYWIPNLTEDQIAKIKELRIANLKEVKNLQNQLGELTARERTLSTADKADIKAIDANIDEISKVKGNIMKSRAHLKQQIRALLTEEQRLFFDLHSKNHHFHKGNMSGSEKPYEGVWHHGSGNTEER